MLTLVKLLHRSGYRACTRRCVCELTSRGAPTFPPHADFEAFLEAAVLALVAVVLVHGAVPVGPAGVGQVPPDAAFEEALTSFAGELSVVLPAGFVPAHDTLDVLALLLVHGRGGRGGGGRGGGVIVVVGGRRPAVGGAGAGRVRRRCALRRRQHHRVHVS